MKRVLELTNNEGVDAVFDGVGRDKCVSFFYLLRTIRDDISSFDNSFKLKVQLCLSETHLPVGL